MSNSVRPHRQQPTRFCHSWDSPAKNTGVVCWVLFQFMKGKRESEVAQSCPTLCDSMDCSSPGSSVHGIFQARVLEWVAIALSDGLLILTSIFEVLKIYLLNPQSMHGTHKHNVELNKPEAKIISSVQFGCSVLSDSLRPHESQHARPPCPSPTPGAYSNSYPSSQWCHPAISSTVAHFSYCPQTLPGSGYFRTSQLFTWGGQSTGVSASASVLPINTQDWSPLGWTGWLSLQSKRVSTVFSNTTVQKHQFFNVQLSSQSNSHIHTWPLEKP